MGQREILALIERVGVGDYKPGSSLRPGWTYHPIPCDDFAGVPTHKQHAKNEFDAITEHLGSWNGKTVLDVGCNVGYATMTAAKDGAIVDGVEADEANADVARAIAEYLGLEDRVTIWSEPLTRASSVLDKPHDVVLMLNVHMWLEQALGRGECMGLMRELAKGCRRIYFQTAHAESAGMHLVKHLKTERDIDRYLKDCWFENVEMMRPTEEHGGVRILFTAEGRL